uniref:Uncharacterized protein n=1 Tax=Oryza glumipatula TaxID=40148 RepID=A0A0E0A1C5_9ORYZ
MSRVAASCGEAATAEGNSMPYDHQSMPTSCPPPRATSGATYSCVPTNELDRACTGSAAMPIMCKHLSARSTSAA